RWISVDLPRVPGGLPPVCSHPLFDRVVRLAHSVVWPAVDGDCSFASWGFSRIHLVRGLKSARDLDTEIAHYRLARLFRGVVEKDVVAVSPQPRLVANEHPDLVKRRPPGGANCPGRALPPHRGKLAWVNSLYVDGDRHPSIVNQKS